MSTRFQYCLAWVLKWEGGKADNPHDRGGRTMCGITQREYDRYRERMFLVPQDVWLSTEEERADIYWSDYWVESHCPQIPEPLDLVMFDSAVQHGPGRAMKFLQQALGVGCDGLWGLQTLNALQEDIAADTLNIVAHDYLMNRSEFYDNIIRRDSTQKVFAKGWANRLQALTEEVS